MTRTTPPRPVDIAAVFPELAPLARTATRLHPRPGSPGVRDSSVGGPLLWPADEPWPVCEEEHDPVEPMLVDGERRRRRVLAALWGRTPAGRGFTDEEQAELDRLERLDEKADPDTPATMLAVAQLYAKDVPDLAAPDQADVLQVLWCPRDHDPLDAPQPVLRWRRASDVADVLAERPEPEIMEYGYLPEPCVLHPERVVEYPDARTLPAGLREGIREWEEASGHRYSALAVAAGWKAGGHASRGDSSPEPTACDCGADLEPLLTAASAEWDETGYWRPAEDADTGGGFPPRADPTRVSIGGGGALQILRCPVAPDHGFGVSVR
ncbi:hypothetical protein AB0C74_05775 [Spirillospora sp. NPDC048832]